ncbi:MAG TPA: lipopolysaccharide transport periplasmic protein LptA [Burkholderiaceae bacterium]
MKKTAVALLLGLLGLAAAQAEKADSTKEATLEADQAVIDNVKQVSTLTGNVVLARGTLLLKAGKAIHTTDPAGYDFVSLYAAPGQTVSFRQKRDGGDLWVEGQAERVEYDGKTEIVQFFTKAKLRQLEGARTTEEITGDFISYNSRSEIFSVNAKSGGENVAGSGRVKMVLQPAKGGAK